MDKITYQLIYKKLNSPEDICRISQEFSQNIGTISSILHQKIVANVRKCHHQVVQKAQIFVRSWQRGDTILEIARQNNFPPVLMSSIMLREMGYKSKSVIKKPEILKNKRLRYEVIQAINNDFYFSPKAHAVQCDQGRMGEELIYNWLKANDLEFLTESDINKAPHTKTPDFLLCEPLNINGSQVMWIESKAVFADEIEHSRYQKKQFRFYEDLYGPGMVVYWYGFLDTIVPNNYLITDYTFFEDMGYDVDRLLNHMVVKNNNSPENPTA